MENIKQVTEITEENISEKADSFIESVENVINSTKKYIDLITKKYGYEIQVKEYNIPSYINVSSGELNDYLLQTLKVFKKNGLDDLKLQELAKVVIECYEIKAKEQIIIKVEQAMQD